MSQVVRGRVRDAKKRRRAAYSAAAGVDRENKSDDADNANEAEAEDSAQAGVNGYLSAFLLVMVTAGFFATVRPTWGHLHGLSGLHYESGFCDVFVACRGVQPLTIPLRRFGDRAGLAGRVEVADVWQPGRPRRELQASRGGGGAEE